MSKPSRPCTRAVCSWFLGVVSPSLVHGRCTWLCTPPLASLASKLLVLRVRARVCVCVCVFLSRIVQNSLFSLGQYASSPPLLFMCFSRLMMVNRTLVTSRCTHVFVVVSNCCIPHLFQLVLQSVLRDPEQYERLSLST